MARARGFRLGPETPEQILVHRERDRSRMIGLVRGRQGRGAFGFALAYAVGAAHEHLGAPVRQRLRHLFVGRAQARSEEHTSELQSLMRISYAVFCLKKKKTKLNTSNNREQQ